MTVALLLVAIAFQVYTSVLLIRGNLQMEIRLLRIVLHLAGRLSEHDPDLEQRRIALQLWRKVRKDVEMLEKRSMLWPLVKDDPS